MAYPTSVTTFTTKNDGDVIATSHVNGLQTEVTAIETQLLLGWTAYVPVWTGASVNPAIGDGTIVGAYHQVGKLVKARIAINMGSTTTYGSGDYTWTLPVDADIDSAGSAHAFDGTTRYTGGLLFPTTSTVRVFISGGSTLWGTSLPHAWGSGDILVITGAYWTA